MTPVIGVGITQLPDATVETLVALSAAVARYQMALEAIEVCEFDSSHQTVIAMAALKPPAERAA